MQSQQPVAQNTVPPAHPHPWVVLKFGGTSVATAARWERIRELIEERRAEGLRPLIVCSAVSGVSDLLERVLADLGRGAPIDSALEELDATHGRLARDLGVEIDDLLAAARRYITRFAMEIRDQRPVPDARRPGLLALGELLSTAIGVRWLVSTGLEAVRLDARELLTALPPHTAASPKQRYLDARCAHAPDQSVRQALETCEADVVVTQGFIARDSAGDTVLLGRGGSDTAAAYLAAKVGAKRLEIWTDVPGLFTCDPRLVPEARFLPVLGYDEAECLAGFGARVLHSRTVHPVREAGIPLWVRWTEHPELPGTRIIPDDAAPPGLKAVVSRTRVCLVTVEKPAGWKPVGVLADVSACFKRGAVPIDIVSSSPSRIRLLVDLTLAGSAERMPQIVEDLAAIADVRVDDDVASVTLVGRGLPRHLDDLAPGLQGLAGEEIRMLAPCASDLSLTLVVPRDSEAAIVRGLHGEFFEDGKERNTWRTLVKVSA